MCFTTYFNRVLSVVAEVTEIKEDTILSDSREQEIVDARCLLVYLLYKTYNLSYRLIGKMINKSGENVSYHIHNFESRKKQSHILEIQYEITTKRLRENN